MYLEEAVGAEFDVLAHELAVHPDQLHGQGVRDELLVLGRWG